MESSKGMAAPYQIVLGSLGTAIATFVGSYVVFQSLAVSACISVAVLALAFSLAWIYRLHKRVSELESDMDKLHMLDSWLFETPSRDSRILDVLRQEDG